MDVSANENGKVDFDLLSKSLDSTLRDTKLVFELVKSGGYAMKIPLLTAFGIGLYALNKYEDVTELVKMAGLQDLI